MELELVEVAVVVMVVLELIIGLAATGDKAVVGEVAAGFDSLADDANANGLDDVDDVDDDGDEVMVLMKVFGGPAAVALVNGPLLLGRWLNVVAVVVVESNVFPVIDSSLSVLFLKHFSNNSAGFENKYYLMLCNFNTKPYFLTQI